MNQILYTGKNSGPASLKSIVRFFAFSIIVFGLIFIGDGSYALYENYKATHVKADTSVPNITFEQESNNAIVTVSHNKGISRVRYHWNSEAETIVPGGSESTVYLDNISIPSGINTLYVTATDINGMTNETSYKYAYDGICIELAVIDSSYIRIKASDVTGLDHITFNWNSGEEITAYPTDGDNTVIEQTTEIPTGLNTLSITAINLDNKTLTKTQDVKGVHPPQIRLYIQGNDLIVMVSDEEGIDKIKYQINIDEEQTIEVGGAKEYSYKYEIAEGQDILVSITAIDVEGVQKTVKGKNY